MNAANLYNHVLRADRNQALMARILINSMTGDEGFAVDISELRHLSKQNRVAVDAFLNWRKWNREASMHFNERFVAIAKN